MAIEDSNCWYRQNFAFLMYSCIGSEAIDLCPVYSRIDHSLFCRDFNCIWDNLFVRWYWRLSYCFEIKFRCNFILGDTCELWSDCVNAWQLVNNHASLYLQWKIIGWNDCFCSLYSAASMLNFLNHLCLFGLIYLADRSDCCELKCQNVWILLASLGGRLETIWISFLNYLLPSEESVCGGMGNLQCSCCVLSHWFFFFLGRMSHWFDYEYIVISIWCSLEANWNLYVHSMKGSLPKWKRKGKMRKGLALTSLLLMMYMLLGNCRTLQCSKT